MSGNSWEDRSNMEGLFGKTTFFFVELTFGFRMLVASVKKYRKG